MSSNDVLVVEQGLHTPEELSDMEAIEVPKEILEEAHYMSLYMEKVLQKDDIIDAEFEAPDEWPT